MKLTMKTLPWLGAMFLLAACQASPSRAASVSRHDDDATGVGGRVFVVERNDNRLAVYDLLEHEILPKRITGLGNMHHAVMAFSQDLKFGYVATHSGQLSRINLETLQREGDVFTSKNSIDIAISEDGRYVATAEYHPGGVTILDARTLAVKKRIPADHSRVTGIVDAPGNRFIATAMEAGQVWIIDASKPDFPVTNRIPVAPREPYDAMITPDGRYYVVGHLNQDVVSVVDLHHPERGARVVSLRPPNDSTVKTAVVKLPHMASWAVAGDHVFVPLVGRPEEAVLDRHTFALQRTIPLRGHPVYSVRSPDEAQVWVSFSGVKDDAYVQVIDTESLKVIRTLHIGTRIYHMDFTPRGSHMLISANGANRLFLVDATTYKIVDSQPLDSPSGVFGPWRAYEIGL